MTFDDYQKKAKTTDLTADKDNGVVSIGFMDKVLGLVGETGEIAEKIKKILRDKNGEMSDQDKQELLKELGDVLWYMALLSDKLGYNFDEVAARNIKKLSSRNKRTKLGGSGDNR